MNNHEIQTIAVIGAGQMGHQIAMLCALGGYRTILQDVNGSALSKAEDTLQKLMERRVQKRRLSKEEVNKAFANLTLTESLKEAANEADFIIEAVVEKLEVKREVFAQLEEYAQPHAILATNSSTIMNSSIADAAGRPDKIINMHFFYPALVMDCVEVVTSSRTSDETAQITMEVCERINRTAVLLKKEISGFIANRILGALQKEAVFLYENGYADFKDIDTICRKALNHPAGPFELMDLSGIDVGYYVMQQRFAETKDPADQPFDCIKEKVEQGNLGRKTGKGWYDYTKEEVRQ
ncbi:3-hydroxyacyl-CoA dehydrogenase family protein [Metabacillus sp. 113a]|uniref:3-hydroxyacyl-CoA dehydrogenase family protein n=1 Tax=Metabacillus sp. 113a TaxID=3404706 RepID=UPI003CFB30F9